jgi:hypothetical protein
VPGSVAGPAAQSAVSNLQTSRPWIGTKGKHRRATTLTFVLRHRAKVVFTVQQVSPVCRTVGRFAVNAHKGVNRVRFTGRVGKRKLVPGTYYLEARTASGQVVQRVTVVVVNGSAPSRRRLQALQAANVCPATSAFAQASPFSTSLFSTSPFFTGGAFSIGKSGAPENASRSLTPDTQSSGLGAGSSSTGRVLASAVEGTARAIRPALVALLAVAILLLGLASLPQAAFADARFTYTLARYRTELAAFGAAALAAVVIAFLVG